MATADLTAQRLRELLGYDPETGVFRWRLQRRMGGKRPGDIAGGFNAAGHIRISVDYGRYLAHRLAWMYVHDVWPLGEIDHINGIRDDNRLANLRDVHTNVNRQNRRTAKSSNVLGIAGVQKRGNRYWARIRHEGVEHYLGIYRTKEEASVAFIEAKRRLHKGCTI